MNLSLFLILTFSILVNISIVVSGHSQRKIRFSVLNKKNLTGHCTTYLSVKQTAKDLPEIWKVDVEHEITESEGLRTSNLLAVLTVPPQLPIDYKLIPGIGYYKFHTETANDFDDAVEICSNEGGHLAIINSDKECKALQNLFSKYPSTDSFNFDYLYVGLHDRLNEGEFITIFGQALNSTGFHKWAFPWEPNGGTKENCGTLFRSVGLNDMSCDSKLPFICEYDLSWVDI